MLDLNEIQDQIKKRYICGHNIIATSPCSGGVLVVSVLLHVIEGRPINLCAEIETNFLSSKKLYSIICHKNPPTHSKHTHLNEVIKNGRCDTCSVLLLLIIFRHVKLVKAKNVLKILRKIEKTCFRDVLYNYVMGHSRNNLYPSIEETENIPLPLSGHPTEVRRTFPFPGHLSVKLLPST